MNITTVAEEAEAPVRRLGLAMAVYAVLVVVFTAVLAAAMQFPSIVDMSAGEALTTFHRHSALAVAFSFLFAGASLLLSVIALATPQALGAPRSNFTKVFTAAGATAGLLRCIGFLRFSLIAPKLADQYVNPSSAAAKEAARTGWLLVNAVVGEGVGDLLAFGLSAVFVACLALTLRRSERFSRRWTSAGLIFSVYGILELGTFVLPKPVVAVADSLFPVTFAAAVLWLGLTGLRLCVDPRRHAPDQPSPGGALP